MSWVCPEEGKIKLWVYSRAPPGRARLPWNSFLLHHPSLSPSHITSIVTYVYHPETFGAILSISSRALVSPHSTPPRINSSRARLSCTFSAHGSVPFVPSSTI
jgi:hypothetical protein